MTENSNGQAEFRARVLDGLKELKAGQEQNRTAYTHTRETVAVLGQSMSDHLESWSALKDSVSLMASQSNKFREDLSRKADRTELNALRKQGSLLGIIGGAIGVIMIWMRGKM